jgi:pimeloyl-ACP methyl ester carboxylesterase
MESVPEIPQKPAEQNKNILQKRTYEIDNTKVTVSWKEFFPTNKEAPQDEAILFLTGWSAGTAKTVEALTQRFAEDSGRTAKLIFTRPEKVVPDSLYKEAEAVRNLIIEEGLEEITVASHSEGGIKASDVVDILQKKNPDIKIRGLILLDPVGLYEQNMAKFASSFILDTAVNTPISLAKNLLKNPSLVLKGLQAGSDIIFNISREMTKTKITGYPSKLFSQMAEMAKANTHYQDVKCPVVLIQGEQDPISSPEKVLPEDPKSISEGREILKQTFFPNSSQVDMLVGKKIPHHSMYHFRPETISKASLGLLERYWRTHQSPVQPTAPSPQGEILKT